MLGFLGAIKDGHWAEGLVGAIEKSLRDALEQHPEIENSEIYELEHVLISGILVETSTFKMKRDLDGRRTLKAPNEEAQ